MKPKKIEKFIVIKSKPKNVFKALTNSDEIIQYFPLKRVESTWQQGSEIKLFGEVNGVEFIDIGIIETIEDSEIFQYNYWSSNHGVENIPENRVKISYQLKTLPEGVKLIVVQSNLPNDDMIKMMDNIWDNLLVSLKNYVESKHH